MSQVLRLFIDVVFVFSVIFIWFMLIYQFVLTLGGSLCRRRLRKDGQGWLRLKESDLPSVSVLIPARNEEKVIAGLIEKIQDFVYPQEKIEMIIINDGSTDQTGSIVRELAQKDKRIKTIDIPAEQSGKGKGAALNRGLKESGHKVIAVYDADNRPEKDSLVKLCWALFKDKRLAAVSGKFRAYNKGRNLLTKLINLESLAFQWLIQAGRWFFLKIAFLAGTNFVIWKSVLEKVGGWDEEALTEDSELTFRIYQRGYLIKFLPLAVSWEQEPEKLRAWFRQRVRWARGNNYVISKQARNIFKAKPKLASIELLNLLYLYYFFIFAILFSDIFFILSLLKLVRLRSIGPYKELWALAFLLFVLEILIALSFEREDSWSSALLAVLAYLTYTKLWVFVVLCGFYEEFILKKKRTWAKTERYDWPAENREVDR